MGGKDKTPWIRRGAYYYKDYCSFFVAGHLASACLFLAKKAHCNEYNSSVILYKMKCIYVLYRLPLNTHSGQLSCNRRQHFLRQKTASDILLLQFRMDV